MQQNRVCRLTLLPAGELAQVWFGNKERKEKGRKAGKEEGTNCERKMKKSVGKEAFPPPSQGPWLGLEIKLTKTGKQEKGMSARKLHTT